MLLVRGQQGSGGVVQQLQARARAHVREPGHVVAGAGATVSVAEAEGLDRLEAVRGAAAGPVRVVVAAARDVAPEEFLHDGPVGGVARARAAGRLQIGGLAVRVRGAAGDVAELRVAGRQLRGDDGVAAEARVREHAHATVGARAGDAVLRAPGADGAESVGLHALEVGGAAAGGPAVCVGRAVAPPRGAALHAGACWGRPWRRPLPAGRAPSESRCTAAEVQCTSPRGSPRPPRTPWPSPRGAGAGTGGGGSAGDAPVAAAVGGVRAGAPLRALPHVPRGHRVPRIRSPVGVARGGVVGAASP